MKKHIPDVFLYAIPFLVFLFSRFCTGFSEYANHYFGSVANYSVYYYILIVVWIWFDTKADDKKGYAKKTVIALLLATVMVVFNLIGYLIVVSVWRDKKLGDKFFFPRALGCTACIITALLPDLSDLAGLFSQSPQDFWRGAMVTEFIGFWGTIISLVIVLGFTAATHYERTMKSKRENQPD